MTRNGILRNKVRLDKRKYGWIGYEIIVAVIMAVFFRNQFDLLLSIEQSLVILIVSIYFVCKVELINFSRKTFLISLPVACVIGGLSYWLLYNGFFYGNDFSFGIGLFIICSFKCLYLANVLVCGYIYLFRKRNRDIWGKVSLASVGVAFFIWIFLPTEVIVGNISEYEMSYQSYILPSICCFMVTVLILILINGICGSKASRVYYILLSSLIFGTYIQYMAFNGSIGIIDGSTYNWQNEYLLSIINILLWLFVIVAVSVLIYKKKEKYIDYAVKLLLAILAVTLVVLLLTADRNLFEMRVNGLTGEKQFVVADHNNVIVFVLDAVDNSFAKEILDDKPEVFEDFMDFTFYTNTCSVYDMTLDSMAQMFSGRDCDGEVADYNGFYDRLHDNDYEVRFYGYVEIPYMAKLYQHLDNYCIEETNSNYKYTVDYKKILENSSKLTEYRILPNIFKGSIDSGNISFEKIVRRSGDSDDIIYYENSDFYNHLNLSLDNEQQNAFIMQHIRGAHLPCDDYIEETEYCLDIVRKYINQLKELGVYDDATIIVTADHGVHDHCDDPPYPTAGTPIFMIKSPGISQDMMSFNDSPVYHTDFLATILINTGLYYEEKDGTRFGPSIYDFEGMKRQRVWYDLEKNNRGHRKYTYTGDTKELENVVDSGIYEVVD